MNTESIIWLVGMLFFLAVEAATVTMVSAWFAVGALAGMAAAMLEFPLWLQILIFLIVSGACIALLRPFAKKMFNNRVTRTNVESLVGKTCFVTEDICNLKAAGRVKLDSMSWAARSTPQADIPAGTLVRVDRIEGVKVYVTPVSES